MSKGIAGDFAQQETVGALLGEVYVGIEYGSDGTCFLIGLKIVGRNRGAFGVQFTQHIVREKHLEAR